MDTQDATKTFGERFKGKTKTKFGMKNFIAPDEIQMLTLFVLFVLLYKMKSIIIVFVAIAVAVDTTM